LGCLYPVRSLLVNIVASACDYEDLHVGLKLYVERLNIVAKERKKVEEKAKN
jgi:hypothetical protein